MSIQRHGGARASVELEITALGGRGDAVARLDDGRVVFVPGGVPGDRVVVHLSGKRRGVMRGEIVELVRPSPHRRAARCPVARRCGGCQWQHIDLQQQHTDKASNIARAVGIEVEPMGQVPEFGWRRRVRFHLRRQEGAVRAGYMEATSRRLIATETCPVLEPSLERLLPVVAAWADPWLERGECLAHAGLEGVIIRVQGVSRARPPGLDEATLERLGVAGVTLALGQRVQSVGLSEVTLSETEGSDPITVDAAGFSQASGAANEAIRAAVTAALEGVPLSEAAVELYAGSGNLTGALLRRFDRVSTWEWERAAVRRARRRYADAIDAGKLAVHCGDVAERAPQPSAGEVWLLDPGRPGAAQVCERLAGAPVDDLIYVSCAADTLARDLKILAQGGLTPARAWWVDTFPQTPHAEAIVHLRRASAAENKNP